jgi:hypothetical protein
MSAAVRTTDPDTSREAAALVAPTVNRVQAAILNELRCPSRFYRTGRTAWELQSILVDLCGIWCDQNSIAKRLSELRDKGLVEDTGERRKGRTNASLTVWRAT